MTTPDVTARPAGTRALLHAVLSAAVAIAGLLLFVLAGDALFPSNLGIGVTYIAGITAIGALVLGIVKRLTGGATETVNLRRSVTTAVLVPVVLGVLLAGILSIG